MTALRMGKERGRFVRYVGGTFRPSLADRVTAFHKTVRMTPHRLSGYLFFVLAVGVC